jgi:hypothetical protein
LLQIDILPQKESRQGVGEAALFAEVGQGDNDAVDFGGVLFEELRALPGVFVGFNGPVRGLLRGEHDGLDAHGFECCNHLQTSAGGKVAGKESTITYDDAHSHLTTHTFSSNGGALSMFIAYALLMSSGRGR